jgi:hypothetical protein
MARRASSVRRQSKHELAAAVQPRYLKATRRERMRLLDEFVASTGYHRRYALTLLRHGRFPSRDSPVPVPRSLRRAGRPRTYSSVVVGELRAVAEALGWPCGKRLAPFLAEVVPVLEHEGVLRVTRHRPEVRAALLGMSAATIDRRLRPFRLQRDPKNWHGLGGTKPGSLLKTQVPVRTYTRWADQRVGFCEIDLVAHCGISAHGSFANSLVLTDLATGWTECAALLGKSQRAVIDALDHLRIRLPFVLLGVDSDNGSEFLNAHLVRYCERHHITFTRGRPYWKNDQAHVEQKNWSVVRRLVGYDRYDTPAAVAQLTHVYELLRLWTNHWQPVRKLVARTHDRATGKTAKRYDAAATPYRRLLAAVLAHGPNAELAHANRFKRLAGEHALWGPTVLRAQLAAALGRLTPLATRPSAWPATGIAAGAAEVAAAAG